MAIPPDPRYRLAEQMDARRRELGLRWKDVATAGNLSTEVLRVVRAGYKGVFADMHALTKVGIERGLRWAPGSIDRSLAGGYPVPLAESSPPPAEDGDPGRIASLEHRVARLEKLAEEEPPQRPAFSKVWERQGSEDEDRAVGS